MLQTNEFHNNVLPTKLSATDSYAQRVGKNAQLTEELHDNNLQNLREMAMFYAREHRVRKNKRCEHVKNNAVAVFI